MSTQRSQFTVFSRILHWTMAAMVLAMLGIGVCMVTSLGNYHKLVSIHRPLGIAILLLVVVRIVNRLWNPPPPLPSTMPRMERLAALASEYTLYGLMIALPLVGWGMLSAAQYPIVLFGAFQLPEILPHSATLFAGLRKAHTILAYFLILAFLAHFAAILFHTVIVRDGIWKRMVPWNIRPREVAPSGTEPAL
jgi:cytochrome b561